MQNLLSRPTYMDYSATTPVDPRVVEKMLTYLTTEFGNPASRSHPYGWAAEAAVEEAREHVAHLVNADPREIVWTSGATESNNLAIKGTASYYQNRGKHLITVTTEHKAVLDTFHALASQGYKVTYLEPAANGLVMVDQVRNAIRPDTILVSVMLVNNEIGVIQDIPAIGATCRERGVVFHCDAAQATGKLPINLSDWAVDLMTFTAHKTYGPKGIGALYIRRDSGVRVEAQIHGGGHERGLRSGTLATHQIVGMGEAFRLAKLEMKLEVERMRVLQSRLYEGLTAIDDVYVNGDLKHRIPHNLNLSFGSIEGESLILALKDLAVSSGSACTSASIEPSHVLTALGRSPALAQSSLRFTIGRFTTLDDVDFAVSLVKRKVAELRGNTSIEPEISSRAF